MKSLLSAVMAKPLTALLVAAAVALTAFVVTQQLTLNSVRRDLATSQATVGRLTESLSLAVKTNADNAAAYRTSVEQLTAARQIAEQARDRSDARNRQLEENIRVIRSSPPEARGPVSPVVRDTVDRLWPHTAGSDRP